MSEEIDNLVLSITSAMIANGLNPMVIQRVWKERDTAVSALREIVRCDYRGNEPFEQFIARRTLDELGEPTE